VVLYGTGAAYLSLNDGVTATKLRPVPAPVDSRGAFAALFLDPGGRALHAFTTMGYWSATDLSPFRYDVSRGSWTALPALPARKDNPRNLSGFRSDYGSPLGMYVMEAGTATTPAQLLVFR
jgi:hypothetical protein